MLMSILQPGVELQDLHSDIINRDIRLYIKLPWIYDRSEETYPVLFALDGNRSFPMYSTMSLIYETPGRKSKETVIVGVGYQVDSDRLRGLAQWAMWRTLDLTPVRREETEQYWKKTLSGLMGDEKLDIQTGGAPLFLKTLEEEIIPFIEANYRVSSTDRGLIGYSYGGLFALYALFHAPEMFRQYFAGSPTMWDQLFDYEEHYASTHDDLDARLFMTAGERESDLIERMERLVDCLHSRGYPGLEVLTQIFEGEGHVSAYAGFVSRALRVLYNEVQLNE